MVNIVYRTDSRAPEEIVQSGGIYPFSDLPPDDDLYERLNNILRDYGTMEEWVAHGSMANAIIISHPRLSGTMLQQFYYSGQIFSELFWAKHWQHNPQYLPALDQDHSASTPYLTLGVPRGYAVMVQNETGQQLLAMLNLILTRQK